MSKFGVYLYETSEGCDYTIGCGVVFQILPKSIKTMEEALKYVEEKEEKGCLHYYGVDRIKKCTIFEITNSVDVNVKKIHHLQEIKQKNLEKENRHREYEKLKEEFEA